LRIFRNSVEKIPVPYQSDTENRHTSHEDQCTFLTISHSALLRMRNVSDKSCRENQNTHFMFSNFFFYFSIFFLFLFYKESYR